MAARLKKIRPFAEACLWMAQQNIPSYRAYAKWILVNELPPDIPRNPFACYRKRKEWRGWPVYLGTTPEARMEQVLQSTVSIAFVNTCDSPGNVYTIIVTPHDKEHIVGWGTQAGFRLAKLYRIKTPSKHIFLEYVQKLKSGYFGEAEKIILTNPIATFSHLDELAEIINSKPDVIKG